MGVKMAYRSIMTWFSVPIALLCSSPARSDISVSVGNVDGQLRYFQSPHHDNGDDARRNSERSCMQSGAKDCQWVLTIPTGICGAIAISPNRRTIGRASLPDSVNAGAAALGQCRESSKAKCDLAWEHCYAGADERAFPRHPTAVELQPSISGSKDWDMCTQSESVDGAIAACTRVIKSGKLQGTALAKAYFYRSARWMAKGNTEVVPVV